MTEQRLTERQKTEPQQSAVLDSAHLGDIEGAFGKIKVDEAHANPGLKQRALTLLAIMGPGLIVMVGDNDAGGVATYAQAGQVYGYSLLWVLLLLVPVLIINQEMVVRLGAVTGVGHARLINERFGRGWGWFSVGDLFLLNFLTIITEFIGVSLAATHLGLSKYIVVPTCAVALIAIMASGNFRRWERAMFAFIAVALLQIPLLLFCQPQWGRAGQGFVVPSIDGGLNSASILLIISMVGTTVAPWQLFFQQSNIVDKRITPRFISYERADTVIGSFVVVIGAAALVMIADYAARSTPDGARPAWDDDDGVKIIADLLAQHAPWMGQVFAIVLLDASIIGAAAVTLSTSYAFGDVFGLKHSLHRSFKDAKQFYFSYTVMIVIAAAIPLIPGAPLGLITQAVQALAGLLLPSASVFLLLLCNDREVLGPWVNKRWLNIAAAITVAVLLLLSGILMATTLFPEGLDVVQLTWWLAGAIVLATIVAWAGFKLYERLRPQPQDAQAPVFSANAKMSWRMPPLALLKPVKWSVGTKLSMLALRTYLVIGAILLVVKAVQLSHGG